MIKKALVLAILAPVIIDSVFAADANHGKSIVDRWCAECHMVGPGQKASTEAPPFSSLAKRPGFDEARVAFFLLDPHPKMPNMQLSRAEVADIAAYIATLK
jgi:mono/diheme cytochrome c family protein